VARAASFHTDEARLKLLEESENLAASQCAIESDIPIPCNAMSLKDVLGQIQTDCGNLHEGGSSREQSYDNCIMAHRRQWSRSHPPHLLLTDTVEKGLGSISFT
jgi:hypothetical protein